MNYLFLAQVLIGASSFMSPLESRSNTSPNRVRMFNKDKLITKVAQQSWDRVKVVCTQPFNKVSTCLGTFIQLCV